MNFAPFLALTLVLTPHGVSTKTSSASRIDSSSIIAPGAKLEMISDGYAFTEGPACDRFGDIYFTDQPNDRIMKWTPNRDDTGGTIREWMKPAGRANGMWFDHHGNLIACADDKNQLWSISPRKKATVLVSDFEGKLLNGPNDVWVRPDGGMYITDPLYARPYWKRNPAMQMPGQFVLYLSRDRKTLRPVATDLVKPNGIIGTPDGKTLYVADIEGNFTYRYHIEPDGSLTHKTKFCDLGSDGMTIDQDGDVYLSGNGVTVFDKTGKEIEKIDIREPWTGHVAFGGISRHTLFITASSRVYTLKMRVRGAY